MTQELSAQELSGAEAVAKILKEEGVKQVFGIHGGHVWSMISAICDQGIQFITMRHEQSAAFAADGWARTTREPGVCLGTAGPGFYNMVPGLAQANLVGSPIVALLGRHRTFEGGWGSFQEGNAAEISKSFAKGAMLVEDLSNVSYIVRKSFRDAIQYPPGPVVVEFPTNILGLIGPKAEKKMQIGYLPKDQITPLGKPQGDPALIEQAVRILLKAKKPILIGGNGLFWAEASKELQEFAELMRMPVHTRRMGRGAVPEKHPLAFTGGYRRPIFKEADVIVIIGHRLNVLEGYGLPPTYPREASYIQIAESAAEISLVIPTQVTICGNPKMVLRQMIDCAQGLSASFSKRAEWLNFVAHLANKQRADNRKTAEEVRDHKPIHPEFLGQVIADYLDPDTIIIYDSFTLGAFVTDRIEAKFSGQVLDAGTSGGVGHGIGMAIGAKLGKPDKRILVMMGDGGTGIAGFDIETAARCRLPVVYLIFNNSGWMNPSALEEMFPSWGSWGLLPDVRYDKIFAEMGCHTELVTEPGQIRPALDRAFASRRTAVLNLIPDGNVHPSLLMARRKLYTAD